MSVVLRNVYPAGFLVRYAALIALFSLARGFFYFTNTSVLDSFSAADIVSAFLLGVRFDLWVVTALMLPLFFLELWAWKSRTHASQRVTSMLSGAVLTISSVFIFCEIADSVYFRFTGRRSTLAILKLSTDTVQQGVDLLQTFWTVPLASLALISALCVVWRKSRTGPHSVAGGVSGRRVLLHVLTGLALGVLAIRGGLQTKPLATAHAALLGHSQLSALALSTSFQFTHSAENRELKIVRFYEDDSYTRKLLEVPRQRHAPVTLKDHNVVVLVVESLSMESLGYRNLNEKYTPFLSSLAEKSLFFENAYANGRTSMEAFPSILASMPSMIGEPFITSQYSSVKMPSLGHELTRRGYSSEFFHGCNNGSMYIDSMAQLFGFERFFGRSEYPAGDKDYDGSWGIFDEPFLQFTAERMSQIKQPFAVGVFTLSSHNPYKIPAHLADKFTQGRRPFHRSLAYADYAIERFFQTASRQPWFSKTLFVITGDHTAELESSFYFNEQGYFRVPLMFYDPSGQLKPQRSQRIVQHTDIFPTVLDVLGVDAEAEGIPLLPFGQSVFIPDSYARAANRAGDWFWYQEGAAIVRMPSDGDIQVSSDVAGNVEIVRRARAYLQFYNNRMSRNELLSP